MSSPASHMSLVNDPVDKTALLASPATARSAGRWQHLSRRVAYAAMCVGSVVVALVSYRYLIPAAHFTLAPPVIANVFARPFLYVHVACSATALLVGPFQFSQSLRRRYLSVHRVIGRLYVMSCLVGGFAGIPIGLRSFAGPIAHAGLFILAVLWIAINTQAWRLAVQGRISEHKRWMVRSFALTFGAVTLRLIIGVLPRLGVPFLVAYQIGTWAAWVPNLLAVEAWMWYYSTGLPEVKRVQADGLVAPLEGNELTGVGTTTR